ncbi:MAG: hypothetical protein ACOX9R_10610 [Armatimonadota bacterium]|jgi:hypothetical protein
MKRVAAVAGVSLALAMTLTGLCVPPARADNDRLREQLRGRERVIDADLRSLRQQERAAEFGSRLYWELRRSSSALERERSALRSLDSALRMGNERLVERRHADYLRAQQETARQQRGLVETRARELQFGSRQWHDHRRVSSTWQRQQRASEPFGPEYRRALEAQIRMLESRRSQVEFGSQQWYAVNRQITALRQALRSAR